MKGIPLCVGQSERSWTLAAGRKTRVWPFHRASSASGKLCCGNHKETHRHQARPPPSFMCGSEKLERSHLCNTEAA